MLHVPPSLAVVVRDEASPRQFPVWFVESRMHYDADAATADAQAVSDMTGNPVPVYFRIRRSAQRDLWTRVDPQPVVQAPIPAELVEPPKVIPRPVPMPVVGSVHNAAIAKERLLEADPHCSRCGNPVTHLAHRPDSAIVLGGKLCCVGCIDQERKQRRSERRPGQPSAATSRRHNLKNDLMDLNPRCSNCKCHLRTNVDAPDTCCLVIDRLSCQKCVRIVRAAVKAERQLLNGFRNRVGTLEEFLHSLPSSEKGRVLEILQATATTEGGAA